MTRQDSPGAAVEGIPRAEGDRYLSVVVAARNDEHGGNLRKRMRAFLLGFQEQCSRHRLNAELVVVEWNPPAESPRLAEVFAPLLDEVRVRIIEVPPSVHARFPNAQRIPLFQFTAKNVGIRRAHGRFVLATNLDLLFSEEVIRRIAEERLDPGSYYRVDRYDVPADVPEEVPLDAQLEYCRSHLRRAFFRTGTHSYVTGLFYPIYPRFGGPLGKPVLAVERVLAELKAMGWLLRRDPEFRDEMLRPEHYWSRISTGAYAARLRGFLEYLQAPQRARLHTNASGDFTLMAKDKWFALRGYPELPLHGMHLDSVLCYMAYYLPLREVVWENPACVYHMEHLLGWTPEMARGFASEEQRRGEAMPRLSHQELNALAIWMSREQKPFQFNEEGWGLAREDLPEVALRGARQAD